MKRVADNQLIKGAEEEEDSEGEGQEGFHKADESVLAGRRIKALPKRSMAAPPSPFATSASAPNEDSNGSSAQSKFGAFSGFGKSSSNTFTFIPPASPSLKIQVVSDDTASPFSKGPSVAPTASNAAKAFSSFLGNSNSKSSSLSAQPTLPDVEAASTDDRAALKYFKSLRGLNISFLSALSSAVDEDPFVDVATLLERYKTLRLDVQKEFDDTTPKETKPISGASSTTSLSSAPSMPTPPASFSGFNMSSSTSNSVSGGFTPKLDNTKSSSPFSFPALAVNSSASSPLFTSSSTNSLNETSSSFGSSSNPFALSDSASTAGNPFKLPESSASSATSIFGTKPPASSSGFSFAVPPSSNTATGTTSSLFGTPTTSSLFGSSNKSTASKTFPFDTSIPSTPPASKPTFGGFAGFGGKTSPAAGSIGNPVGFGFGSPSKADSGTSSGFSFTQEPPQKFEERVDSKEDSDATGSQETQTEGDDGSTLLFGKNPHDEEGEGEEGEETVHSIRLKAFRLKKAGEPGSSGWADMGTGILRLKKHKQTGQRRVLLRNSSTGKIIINFNLYSGLLPSQTKKTIMFVGHEEGGVSQTYNVRTKTEEQATELKTAMDREIAFVKAKSDS